MDQVCQAGMDRDTDGRVIQDSRVDRVCRVVHHMFNVYAYHRYGVDAEPTTMICKIDKLRRSDLKFGNTRVQAFGANTVTD